MSSFRFVRVALILAVVAATSALSLGKDHCASLAGDKRCKICEEGFFVDPDTGDCHQQGLPGCLVYERNRNACLEWAGEGGVAARALQTACPSLQYPLDGACVPLTNPVGCATSSGTADRCDECQDLYYLVNSSTCVLGTVTNCAKYSLVAPTCIACLQQSLPNCVAYAPNANVCMQCTSSYSLVNGACTMTPLKNCKIPSTTSNTCQQCNSLFYLVTGSCVAITPANCTSSDGLVNACSACNPCYYLTSNKACALQNIPNCLTYMPQQNACQTCVIGYVPSGGLCVVNKSLNCTTYDAATNSCQLCNSLFYVSYGKCLNLTIANCQTSGGLTNTCTDCASGYYRITSGGCARQSVTNCTTYLPSSNTCTQCSGALIVWLNMCVVNNGLNCQTYTAASNRCSLCNSRYYLSNYGCIPLTEVNCATSNGLNNTCQACASGYYLTAQLNCAIQSITGCTSFVNNKNECMACASPYVLTGSVCVLQATGCVEYNSNHTFCQKCDNLMYPDTRNTSCLHIADANCQTSNGIDGVCQQCVLGYELNAQSMCGPPYDVNCAAFIFGTNICIECKIGYFLSKSVCKISIPNCRALNSGTLHCQECNEGFFLKDDRYCAALAPHCKVFNQFDQTICSECLPSSELAGYPQFCLRYYEDIGCLSGGREEKFCQACSMGLYDMNDGKGCQIGTIKNCIRYSQHSSFTPICYECIEGYKSVLLASSDPNQYVFCVPLAMLESGLNPLDPLPATKVCSPQMYIDASNNCQYLTDVNCVYGDGVVDVCQVCKLAFYLADGKCLPTTGSNCQTWVLNQNRCEVCIDGQYINSATGFCVAERVPNCDIHDQVQYRCLTCKVNYQLTSTGSCRLIVASDCAPGKFVDGATPYCTGCVNRYVLSRGSCVRHRSECIQTDAASTTCTQACPSGQYFDEVTNTCVPRTDLNCFAFVPWSKDCAICQSGYYLTDAKTCDAQFLQDCIKYRDNENYCLDCKYETQKAAFYGRCNIAPYCGIIQPNNYEPDGCLQCTGGYMRDKNWRCVPHNYPMDVVFPDSGGACKLGYQSNSLTDLNAACVKVENCLVNQENLPYCYLCDYGYYSSQGNCIARKNMSCKSFARNYDTCLYCYPGQYVNTEGVCVPQTVEGCETVSETSNHCATCPPGKTLIDLVCV